VNWLAQLSFPQALRWALLWPALVVVIASGAVAFATSQHNWGFAFGIESRGPLPVWLAVTAFVAVAVLGPPALFLALWRVARR
jgi:hypothetical protein